MCMIERYDLVYPDGRRETRERVVNCPRGTPSRPCNNVEVVPLFEDHLATASDRITTAGSDYHAAIPRNSEETRSRPGSRDKSMSLFDELALIFKILKPFSSKKSKKVYLVRERARPQVESPAVVHHYPRAPTPPPPSRMAPRGRSPVIVRIAPTRRHHSPSPRPRDHETRRRRRRDRSPILIQQSSSSSDYHTPSPPIAARDHQRKSRSISPRSRREALKKLAQEKEDRLYAERVAKQEDEARRRAARVAEYERLERERIRRERIEYEERKRLETAERARRRQQQEGYERAQAKRRQELEDLERLDIARRREHRERYRRNEEERYRWEEEYRLAQARRANVPRQPHHEPAVNYERASMEDRGERFIREAIRQENLLQFERQAARNAGWPGGAYEGEGLRRRDTIGGGRRYGGQPERRDRRWD